MRKTARAIILKDKKILLVSGHGADYYWTPGGGITPGESANQAVARELYEELGITSAEYTFFNKYIIDDQDVTNYLAEVSEEIKSGGEVVSVVWASKSDILNDKIKVSKGFREKVFDELVNQKHL